MRVVDAESAEIPAAVPEAPPTVHEDASGWSEAELAERVAAWTCSASAELDPWQGANLAAAWFDRGPGRAGRLALVAHHLVVDGVSWRVMIADLEAAWAAVEATSGRTNAAHAIRTATRASRRGAAATGRAVTIEHSRGWGTAAP
jgi:hypothetical protein